MADKKITPSDVEAYEEEAHLTEVRRLFGRATREDVDRARRRAADARAQLSAEEAPDAPTQPPQASVESRNQED